MGEEGGGEGEIARSKGEEFGGEREAGGTKGETCGTKGKGQRD